MNILLNKEMNKVRNATIFKGCLHVDENCNEVSFKAHSKQINRYISNIAKDGNVVCIDFSKSGLK